MSTTSSEDLVFALCHEMGNLIGAIRLQAHLIDEEMGPKDLAIASVELDDLSARVAALLSHIRPLVCAGPNSVDELRVGDLFAGLSRSLEEVGARGVSLTVACDEALPSLRLDREVVHHLLESFVYVAIESARPSGSVSLKASETRGGVSFVISDDGPVVEDPAGWADQAMRGRPLLCAIASDVIAKRGGSFAAERSGDVTRVTIWLPGSVPA